MNSGGRGIRTAFSDYDGTLAGQSFSAIDGDGLSSEQRLMLAVLIDAINILNGRIPTGGLSKRQVFAETAHWVAVKGTYSPFTFDSVCAALNLPEDMIRARLNKLARGAAECDRSGMGRLRRQRMSRVGRTQLDPPALELKLSVKCMAL